MTSMQCHAMTGSCIRALWAGLLVIMRGDDSEDSIMQGAQVAQQAQQAQHGTDEAPVLAAQEPHQGVAAPATGLYALVRAAGHAVS